MWLSCSIFLGTAHDESNMLHNIADKPTASQNNNLQNSGKSDFSMNLFIAILFNDKLFVCATAFRCEVHCRLQ